MGRGAVPPVDAALAYRVEAPDVAYAGARLEAIAAMPGNPHGARTVRAGSAVALCAPGMRSSMFQRLCLADDELLPHLDTALQALAAPGMPWRVDVVPPLPCTRLVAALGARGFRCTGFYSGLYGLPVTVRRERRFPGRVRPLEPGELDVWIDVYRRGFGFQPQLGELMAHSLRGLPPHAQAELLVAELDGGRIAAMAALWVEARTGYLAVAATLPEARGRGCHAALLDARIARAAELGCELVVAHAAVGSASQHNMEHAGLRLAFHKAIWLRPPSRPTGESPA